MRVNESGWETWNETHRERERERDCRFVCGTFVERIEMNIKLKNHDKDFILIFFCCVEEKL